MADPKITTNPEPAPATDDDMAMCRVLKAGDGKISTGAHGPDGEEYYAKGDQFIVAKGIANALEDRGLIEIQ